MTTRFLSNRSLNEFNIPIAYVDGNSSCLGVWKVAKKETKILKDAAALAQLCLNENGVTLHFAPYILERTVSFLSSHRTGEGQRPARLSLSPSSTHQSCSHCNELFGVLT